MKGKLKSILKASYCVIMEHYYFIVKKYLLEDEVRLMVCYKPYYISMSRLNVVICLEHAAFSFQVKLAQKLFDKHA